MIYLILDILVSNYTKYTTYFFLLNLSSKSLFYNLIIAFILDFFILKTYCLNLILILIFYLINSYVFRQSYPNFWCYFLVNLLFIIVYNLVTMGLFNSFILANFNQVLVLNSFLIIISYIKFAKSIKLIR